MTTYHKSITQERLEEALVNAEIGGEHPGFCKDCGADHDACEPDAQGYECYECGERRVDSVYVLMGII